MHHVVHKFHEVFQLKQDRYSDLSAAKISEMMKSNSLDNAPTQSLLSVVNGILDESIERKNDKIPHRVACLLRKVVQEIERRISTQAEHLRTARIRVLEALASGTGEERGVVMDRLQQIKIQKSKMEEEKKTGVEHVAKLIKEQEQRDVELSDLKQELKLAKQRHELHCLQMETEAKAAKDGLEGRMKELEILLEDSRNQEKQKFSPDSKTQQALRSPVMTEPSAASMHHVVHKFHEVFQLKQGRYSDLSAAKISEMMKSNSLDNAPTQSLLSVVNGILDESIERKNDKIPHRVACLLRKVVQEIERRISTQAEHLRTARIRVLEALASGTGEERGVVMDRLQQIKIQKSKMEEEKKTGVEHVAKLIKEQEQRDVELSDLKQELKLAKQRHELHCLQMETEAKAAKDGLEGRMKELEILLEDSRNQVRVLEAYSQSKSNMFNKKEHIFKSFVEFQFGALKELMLSSKSIKHEILQVQKSNLEEFNDLGVKLKALIDATGDYHIVLAENRRMFNELQELKGNIRVYCRIRPFLPGQAAKHTTVEYIGEHGELAVVNPSKQGKDRRRNFKFNKIFGPESTQAKVYSDTQPLIRSVLDGNGVCIFAYGQTGSRKTYTMTGPNGASEEDWGVNYRALNDLFSISQNRRDSFLYEIQPNGLVVPDASMHPVTSTSDVLELIGVGLKNRVVGATAMNERSSRSHSVVSIHVRGKDLLSGAALHGNLHLVDLAGSERVDRSEATGDRLKEAQHINKSLSALGDVIFSLAQKNSHVPYRNSKLTQLLQSSLGGQAKTLMFVQLNPDVSSYSETISTLKFAERVSGVELGVARSSKEGRDVRELMDQIGCRTKKKIAA
ncbi:hypothetical protein DKX38_022127 [Salix brachista]|uniref:Kinesin motor domain-containing protein n=1 Tax=Salix brachista TaxID=2182728 RepID=A0A5N5JYT8_9ROSI|nr:hypothetical protein DKX38_022127 [Salix brachista]